MVVALRSTTAAGRRLSKEQRTMNPASGQETKSAEAEVIRLIIYEQKRRWHHTGSL